MSDSPHDNLPHGRFDPQVLFDNGVARVETHPEYGAIVRGAITVEVIFGAPAFVPAQPGEDDVVIVPDDVSGLV